MRYEVFLALGVFRQGYLGIAALKIKPKTRNIFSYGQFNNDYTMRTPSSKYVPPRVSYGGTGFVVFHEKKRSIK